MPWVAGMAVRILTHEGARAGDHTVSEALVALVRREVLAGITIARAVEGIGGHGRLRTSGALGAAADLPLVVDIVDRRERLEPLLPELAALATSGVVTIANVRLYLPADALRVRDVMLPADHVVQPETPLTDVLATLLDHGVRLVPVVSPEGSLRGVITLGHLLRAADPQLARHLLESGTAEHARHSLERLVAAQPAGEYMQTQPVVAAPELPLASAARLLTSRHVTRVPVVDGERRLLGMLSEHAIAAALVAPTPASDEAAASSSLEKVPSAAASGSTATSPTAAGATAGMLATRDVGTLVETAPWDEVVRAVEAAPAHLVLVARRADGRFLGVIDERILLEQVAPTATAGLARVLRRLLVRTPGQVTTALRGHRGYGAAAGELARRELAVVPESLALADALAAMLGASRGIAAVVVAADGRAVGVLWRTEVLRALLAG
jgi:CBS domain-containing protein